MDWICKIERGCEEERMNVVICLMLSTCAFCCFGTIVQVFQASVLQPRCATAAALIRRECADRNMRATPLNLLTLAFFIWPDIQHHERIIIKHEQTCSDALG